MRLKARQTSSFNSTGSSGAIFIAFGHRIIWMKKKKCSLLL
jgi:hypothetical protein